MYITALLFLWPGGCGRCMAPSHCVNTREGTHSILPGYTLLPSDPGWCCGCSRVLRPQQASPPPAKKDGGRRSRAGRGRAAAAIIGLIARFFCGDEISGRVLLHTMPSQTSKKKERHEGASRSPERDPSLPATHGQASSHTCIRPR